MLSLRIWWIAKNDDEIKSWQLGKQRGGLTRESWSSSCPSLGWSASG